MHSGPRFFVLLLIIGPVAGCAHLGGSGQAGLDEVDRLLAQQRYYQAHRLLSDLAIRPGEPAGSRLQQRRRTVARSIEAYEASILSTAEQYEQQGEWAKAEAVLLRAMRRAGGDSGLRRAYRDLLERQEAVETALRAELAIHEAERLLKDAHTYQKMARLGRQGWLTRLEIGALADKRHKVARQLTRYGRQAMAREDVQLAERCFRLADSLHSSADSRRGIRLAEAAGPGSRRDDNRPSLNRLVERYQAALSRQDLLEARELMQTMRRHFPRTKRVEALDTQLEQAVSQKVRQASERARTLYSEGQVAEALAIWQKMLALDPDNLELRASIARAERVLENLRLLQEKQSG